MPNLSSAVKLFAITWNSMSPALAVTPHAISPKLLRSSNRSSTKSGSTDMCYHWPVPTQYYNTLLLLNSPQPPTSSHLESTYIPFHESAQPAMAISVQRPPLPWWFFSLALIFCPSRGRGLAVSCLSARQFYLSITKPSAVLQRPQHCINPLSASQPSITPLSITSDPSSAHLSHTAHARRWSPQRVPLASHRGWRGQQGRRKLEGNAETEDKGEGEKIIRCPSLPSPSLSLHPAESILFMSLHAY